MMHFSDHAVARFAQRALRASDAELIAEIGTAVDDGFLLRNDDAERLVRELKQLIEKLLRLRGKRLVVAGNVVVTAYHANPRKQRRLLRDAPERDLAA